MRPEEFISVKNPNDTVGNRTRDFWVCSKMSQPTAPPLATNNTNSLQNFTHYKYTSLKRIFFLEIQNLIRRHHDKVVGRDSSVGIATGYGLDGPRIESRWGRVFPHLSRPALGPTQPPVQWVPGLSWGSKERPGRNTDLSPPSRAAVIKE